MVRLVVFDLDGTLVDSREDLAASANDVLIALGGAPLSVDRIARLVGDGARVLVERALASAGVTAEVDDALARFHRSYATRLTATTRPYDGIDEVLQHLGGSATLAVLTNKPLVPTMTLIDAFGWTSAFAHVIGGDGVFARKPDPQGLRALMTRAGAASSDTLMVGDSMNDVGAAHAAGARVCFAAYGFGNARGDVQLAPGDLVADAPRDILRVFRSV